MGKPKLSTQGIIGELVTRRRDLPHWDMGGATYFLTFRLHGSPGNLSPLTTDERQIVKKAILSLHTRMWRVHLLAIMPDHAHIVATPMHISSRQWHSLAAILQRVGGGTAFSINTLGSVRVRFGKRNPLIGSCATRANSMRRQRTS